MKTKLLISLLILLAGLTVLSLYVSRSTADPTTQPPIVEGDTQFPTSQGIVPLPDDDESISDTDIQQRFRGFLVDPSSVSSFTTISSGGRPISLDRFLGAMGAEINPELNALLDQGMWQLYRCPFGEEDTVEKIVLSTRMKLMPEYDGNLFTDKVRYLQVWERSIVNDIAPIIFPEKNEATLATPFEVNRMYPQIDLRQSIVTFSDGTDAVIGYIYVGDEILVGNDVECLREAQEILFDTGA